ncbi:MAG TPA: SUMF1/EgtB/PvdO family nonheme iron enzyme [Tepidisphaeraceae bacterium]|jgi:formylglycine-generating enzyme required for sulfatase activity
MIDARSFTILVLVTSAAGTAHATTLETVPVANPGNPSDTVNGKSFGAVGYAYNIGKYEVTVGQYTAFLNAVAATDTYGLYDAQMASDLNIAGIARSGSAPNYNYNVIGSPNHPVTYVSWGDAARFTNWLHNGQPTGPQSSTTTESGAYALNGAVTDASLIAVPRSASAKWFLPTENEWYKAAYHQPAAQGGDSDGYWQFPMKTNDVPYSDQPPGDTPDNTRVGNFRGDPDGFAVTGKPDYDSSQNYLTDVGAYVSSPSYYGTFDQGGNVGEWTQPSQGDSACPVRGASWFDLNGSYTSAYIRVLISPTTQSPDFGFRVAAIAPEPTMLCFVALAWASEFVMKRRRRGRSATC